MKKLLFSLLVGSMIFATSCSYISGKDSEETINKGMDADVTYTGDLGDKTTSPSNIQQKNDIETITLETPKPVGETDVAEQQANDNTEIIIDLPFMNKKNELYIIFYYQDAEGNIIPISRRVERLDAIARGAINGLVDSAINREEVEFYGVYPVLPQGTQVLGINVVNSTATIDFNSTLLNYKTEAAERNIVSSIVYTLTQFKTISSVKILVDGRPQKKLKFNTDISGVLSRATVLINANKVNLETGKEKTDAYVFKYVNDKDAYMVPVSVEHNKIESKEKPEKIMELLTQDFNSRKLNSQLPAKTKLIGSSIKGNVLTVDLNSEIRNYGGNTREEAIVKQILYSMKQINGIDRVKVLIEGKEAILPEGTELIGEINLPTYINEIIEE